MKLDEPRPRPEPRPRQGQGWGQTQVHAQNHGLNDDRGQQLAALHSPRLRFRRNVMDCRKAGIRIFMFHVKHASDLDLGKGKRT